MCCRKVQLQCDEWIHHVVKESVNSLSAKNVNILNETYDKSNISLREINRAPYRAIIEFQNNFSINKENRLIDI